MFVWWILTDWSLCNKFSNEDHCHYKQSLVLSHANDLCDYYNLITTHPHKRTITKLRFNKSFYQNPFAFNCHEFGNSNKHV